MVRRCWVNLQCRGRGVLLIWMAVGQGPIGLAAGGVVRTFLSFVDLFSFLSPSLGHGPM